MIAGVHVIPRTRIPDERGAIYHFLRADDPQFIRFGEIYFSKIFRGVIKGWHWHEEMTLNYYVAVGAIKLVLYDDRPGSVTAGQVQEVFLGDDHPAHVIVPPQVWNGFKGMTDPFSLVANCATIPHRKDEIRRMDPFDQRIPYNWDVRHG
jgi:dTDP-4-dehydrorhamnose 3,5-epimerase